MKFLLDESVEYRLAAFLRTLGHDVTAIAHDYPHGLADRRALKIAQGEGCILISNDRDLAELIFSQRLSMRASSSCGSDKRAWRPRRSG